MILLRSVLFAPANRPELLAKFPRYDADAFVIDLEDGTPEGEKTAARTQLPAVVASLRGQDVRGRLFVRINEVSSRHAGEDVAAVADADVDGLVIPKLEDARDLQRLAPMLADVERRRTQPLALIGGIETMAGVANVHALGRADPRVLAIYFGAEDFITDIGGQRTADGLEVLYARSRVVLAAKLAGVGALDQVVVDIRDDEQFRRDAGQGKRLGYDGKLCLGPRQVELANEVFSPSPDEIARSVRLVDAARAAAARGRGAIEFEGHMIDEPLLKRAEAIIELASRVRTRKSQV